MANTKQLEDDAMIARLLAYDSYNPSYEDQQDFSDDSGGSDYGRPAKKKAQQRKKGGTRAPPKAKVASNATEGNDSAPPTVAGQSTELSATGRRKRKDAGAARAKSNAWTESEEALFLEALEKYGRDWKQGAAHVASRDARAFSSHAQKHLIKLCIAGKALPAKVAESGLGYTLSGKPLDPNSAAAKAYGITDDVLKKLQRESNVGLVPPPDENTNPTQEPATAAADKGCDDVEKPDKVKKGAGKPSGGTKRKAEASPVEEAEEAPTEVITERTEYAKARPRRAVATAKSTLGATAESLELVACSDFIGPPGSGSALAQPYKVEVHNEALLTMDLHAHLSMCEIIGLLGGTWDAANKVLCIKQAFPCRQAAGSVSGTSVELDPAAEVETRALMADLNLKPVGWYHSHPIFEPQPSIKDIENQRNYQALFRCAESQLEPFVAGIVGPYDLKMPSEASVISWFIVQTKAGNTNTPYNIKLDRHPMVAHPTQEQVNSLLKLLETFAKEPSRAELMQPWVPFYKMVDGSEAGAPLTKLAKMCCSLRRFLPQSDAEQCDKFLTQVTECVETAWRAGE